MNTFFNTREIEGRYKWITLNMKDVLSGKKTIHYTEDPFEVYDFDMTASTVLSYGEIKTVHRNYADYKNFQIDYKKVKSLQTRAQKDGRVPYLVCFFDDYTIVWDVSGIDLEERKYIKSCTSTTADYGKSKRDKDEVWLTIGEAIWSSINEKKSALKN